MRLIGWSRDGHLSALCGRYDLCALCRTMRLRWHTAHALGGTHCIAAEVDGACRPWERSPCTPFWYSNVVHSCLFTRSDFYRATQLC